MTRRYENKKTKLNIAGDLMNFVLLSVDLWFQNNIFSMNTIWPSGYIATYAASCLISLFLLDGWLVHIM